MKTVLSRTLFLLFFVYLVLSSGISFAQPSSAFLDFTEEERRWLEGHDNIKLSFDAHFPPYSFLNEEGELEGLSVDVFKLIGRKLGKSFSMSASPEWDVLYNAAKHREVDVVATMVRRKEREQWFNFTTPYIDKVLVVMTPASDTDISRRSDIAGKTVALVKEYQYVSTILETYPSVKPYFVDNMQDALNAVSVGKADATITFLGAGHYYRNKFLMTNLKYAAVYDKQTAKESVAVRKDWPELASILDKVLRSIPEQKMQALREHWLPVEYMDSLVEIVLTQEERLWIQENRTIRLGVDPEFAPFEYLDNGVYKGMASDYVKILNQRLNLNMDVVRGLSWQEVIKGAEGRELDVLPAVGITEERKKYLLYTQPYLHFHRVIITRSDMPLVANLSDLKDRVVAVQENTSHHGYLMDNSDLKPVLYSSLKSSLMAVSGGEVDAFIGNVASSTYWIRKLNLSNLKVAAPVSTDVQKLHFAVRSDWPELASILQKGIDSITAHQHKNISEKWLSLEYEPKIDFKWVWRITIAFSLVIIGFVFWSATLKHQVRLRTSQLDYTANYDQLTDLPNRFLIMDRLLQSVGEAQRANEKLALLSIDLDDFKKVNDAFGHETGDSLLKEVAGRLKEAIPEGDTVGRLGGDQFLVIISHLSDLSDIALLAESMQEKMKQRYFIHGKEIAITISVGISIFPDDGDNPELLLKHADTANHFSKEQSQGSYAFYSENFILKVSRRLELEQRMRLALDRKEFHVYYQSKVDTETREIVSFEALIRWFNLDLGVVSPVEFIPLAEKNGMMDEVGQFVLQEALDTLAEWQKRFNKEFSMAVNLSPVQLREEDFVPRISSTLLNAGVNSKYLELEITEGVLLEENSNFEVKLKELEALGVMLAMDDFGTGYSSLSYLRKYKFDTIKIDREFIADMAFNESDRKLVSAAIAMSHGLGMRVVAEGVETEHQYTIFSEQKCDYLQGWLFSQAMPKDKMTELLEKQFS